MHISRRTLFASAAGILFSAPLMGNMMRVGRQVYGPLTIERHWMLRRNGLDLHVFYHGEDVTDWCRFANDTPGHECAHLFKHTADGKLYVDPETGNAARDVVTRGVTIRPLA